MKKYIIFGLIVLLALGIIACGETTTPEKVEKTSVATPGPAPAPEPPKQEIFKIGDTVKMGNIEFTVNSARFDEGSEWFKPDPGIKWLAVDVSIKNNSNESEAISSLLMFKLYDEEHYSAPMELMAETKGSLDGELGAGRTMRGEVAFSVPDDHEKFEFIFAPNVIGFGEAIYSIGVSEVN